MKTLDNEPKIISMAHGLGIHHANRVNGIMDFCRAKVAALIKRGGKISSIEELENLVCQRLNLIIVEVWNDQQLSDLIEEYARKKRDFAFVHLLDDLDSETFATLIRCEQKTKDNEDQYVAVIDCRGEKSARRFFTRWHEIAHVLTLFQQLELPLHRSTVEKDAIEKLMDMIAADIGFYPPLFAPILSQAIARESRLSFEGIKWIRDTFCSTASLEATFNAASSQTNSPVIPLQAALGYKRDEARELASQQLSLIPAPKPVPQLRVKSAVANEHARNAGLKIPPNMRVPKSSVIMRAFNEGPEFSPLSAEENLSSWSSSRSGPLSYAPVHVEAMRVGERVWALITPVDALTHPIRREVASVQ